MNVDVRCYGEVAETVGATEFSHRVDDGSSVADLLGSLTEAYPQLDVDALSGGLVVMRNGRHADEGTELTDGDAISLSQSPMRE